MNQNNTMQWKIYIKKDHPWDKQCDPYHAYAQVVFIYRFKKWKYILGICQMWSVQAGGLYIYRQPLEQV